MRKRLTYEEDEEGDFDFREDATYFKIRVDKDEDNFPSGGEESPMEEDTVTNDCGTEEQLSKK